MNQNTGWSRRVQGRRVGLAVAAMALSVFLTGFSLNPFSSSAPVLMILAHAEAGNLIKTEIAATIGASVSPETNKPQQQWLIGSGETTTSGGRPADRTVKFYKGTSTEGILLFIVKVRYFPGENGGWVPQYQIDEEPLVVRKNGSWQPLTSIQGVPSLIVQTGTALPNAEGYFTSLQFGFTTGPTSIDAWTVQ